MIPSNRSDIETGLIKNELALIKSQSVSYLSSPKYDGKMKKKFNWESIVNVIYVGIILVCIYLLVIMMKPKYCSNGEEIYKKHFVKREIKSSDEIYSIEKNVLRSLFVEFIDDASSNIEDDNITITTTSKATKTKKQSDELSFVFDLFSEEDASINKSELNLKSLDCKLIFILNFFKRNAVVRMKIRKEKSE
jgi:hypothetical protein